MIPGEIDFESAVPIKPMIGLKHGELTEMKKLSEWLTQYSKLPVVFTALAIFAIFVILVLPAQPKIGVTEDFNPGYPDLAFWYSPDTLYGIADAYGVEGRGEYELLRHCC